MTHLLPVFVGQSLLGLIIIVTHIGLYLALRRHYDELHQLRSLLEKTYQRIRNLEKELE